MLLLLLLCLIVSVTAQTCPAYEPTHFCGENPLPSDSDCSLTPCGLIPPTCGFNRLRFQKTEGLTFLRYRQFSPCCCAERCLQDTVVQCDGVEFDGKLCHLVTASYSLQFPYDMVKTKKPVYVKTNRCNSIPISKDVLSLSPLTGHAIHGVHTVGISTGSGIEDKGFHTCFASSNTATDCDLVPFGTDKNYREINVGGNADIPLGYCSRTKGLCGAVETLKVWNHTLRYDKVYRTAGFDDANLRGLGFKDAGIVGCYFWYNKDGVNC